MAVHRGTQSEDIRPGHGSLQLRVICRRRPLPLGPSGERVLAVVILCPSSTSQYKSSECTQRH